MAKFEDTQPPEDEVEAAAREAGLALGLFALAIVGGVALFLVAKRLVEIFL